MKYNYLYKVKAFLIFFVVILCFSISNIKAQKIDSVFVHADPPSFTTCFGSSVTISSVQICEKYKNSFGSSGTFSEIYSSVKLYPPTGYEFTAVNTAMGTSIPKDINLGTYFANLHDGIIECWFQTDGNLNFDTLFIKDIVLTPTSSVTGNSLSVVVDLYDAGNDSTYTLSAFNMEVPNVTLSVSSTNTMFCEYGDQIDFTAAIGGTGSCTYDSILLVAYNTETSTNEILEVYKKNPFATFSGSANYTISTEKINRNHSFAYALLYNKSISIESDTLEIGTINEVGSYTNNSAPIQICYFDHERGFLADTFSFQADLSKISLMGLIDYEFDPYDVDGYSGATSEALEPDDTRHELFLIQGNFSGSHNPFRFENKDRSHQAFLTNSMTYDEYNDAYWFEKWNMAYTGFYSNAFLTINGSNWLGFEESGNDLYYKELKTFNKNFPPYLVRQCYSTDTTIIVLQPEDINIPSTLCAVDGSTHKIRVSEDVDEAYTPPGTEFKEFRMINGTSDTILTDDGNRQPGISSYYNIVPSDIYGSSIADKIFVEFLSIGMYDGDGNPADKESDIILASKTIQILATRDDASLLNIDSTFCYDTNAIRLYCNYSIDSVKGDGVSKSSVFLNDWFFNSATAYDSSGYELDSLVGDFRYYFTDDRGCPGNTVHNYTVYQAPKVSFQVSDLCVDETSVSPISFNTDSSKAGKNDTINHYTWAFGDGTIYQSTSYLTDTIPLIFDNGETSGTKQSPKHVYSNSGEYIISLLLESTKGCERRKTDTIRVEDVPNPAIGFEHTGFFQDVVSFTNETDSSNFETDYVYAWDFGDGQSLNNDSVGDNIDHTYAAHAIYDVVLSAITLNGCADSILVKVPVFPYVEVTNSLSASYNFSQDSGWYKSADFNMGSNSGWRLANVSGVYTDSIHNGGQMWLTGANSFDLYNENSWIESPCFDISDLDFPMISLDIYQSVQEGSDGAVLQYTVNDGKNWGNVGDFESGQNWFNTERISSAPGDQSSDNVGWSAFEDMWQDARFPIDDIREEAADSNASCVRFRIAYASNGDNGGVVDYNGFAFDNFELGQRRRVVLLEEFINANYTGSATTMYAALDTFVNRHPKEVVDIRYHIKNSHDIDPLYSINEWDNSARASEYGAIAYGPMSVIDGVSEDVFTDLQGYTQAFNNRSLKTPPFEIIDVTTTLNGNSMDISATIRKKSGKTDALNTKFDQLVRMAIVQKNMVDENNVNHRNVLIDLLPNGAGNVVERIPPSLAVGEEVQVNATWTPNIKTQGNEYRLIIYVQSVWGINEVQQVWFSDDIADAIPQIATSVNDITENNTYRLYPNPVTDLLNVEVKKDNVQQINWSVYSMSGNMIKDGETSIDGGKVHIPVKDLSRGIYIFKILEPNGKLTSFKILKIIQ